MMIDRRRRTGLFVPIPAAVLFVLASFALAIGNTLQQRTVANYQRIVASNERLIAALTNKAEALQDLSNALEKKCTAYERLSAEQAGYIAAARRERIEEWRP